MSKGVIIHLECPRVGTKLGGVPEGGGVWLTSDRLVLPSLSITHISRDADGPVGSFQWNGRTSGIVEAVVRNCVSDAETHQTYYDVDLIAERRIATDGQMSTRTPSW